MKTKIEALANLAVIIIALVVGSVFLKERLSGHGPQPEGVKAGDKLPRIDGWDWGAHDRTLVLVLRKGCHFCEDSMPFYQRLVVKQKEDGSTSAIVAFFPDPADAAKEAVRSEGLEVKTLGGVPLKELKVEGTPSLLLVNNTGTVLKAWMGVLSPKEELEVIEAVCPNGRFREPS